MGLRPDWGAPTRADAYRSLFKIQDDNSYYSACTGFKGAGFGDIDDEFQGACVSFLGKAPLRVQNLTPEALNKYQSDGWSNAQPGIQCVLDQGNFVLNPDNTQFQIYCINNCIPVKVVESGEWERAGDAIRQSYQKLWEKFQEMYPQG